MRIALVVKQIISNAFQVEKNSTVLNTPVENSRKQPIFGNSGLQAGLKNMMECNFQDSLLIVLDVNMPIFIEWHLEEYHIQTYKWNLSKSI